MASSGRGSPFHSLGPTRQPMQLEAVLASAAQAWALLAAYPFSWLAVVVVFLVAVEALTFIPYIGFLLKLAVAGIVGAQLFSLFVGAASGSPPNPLSLFAAFGLPVAAQLTLAFAAALPLLAGLLYLYLTSGASSLRFFFGNIFKEKPPGPAAFVRFKYVMHLVALPLSLVVGAVVLTGASGVGAFTAALSAAAANWLPVLSLGLLAVAFEGLSVALPQRLPKPMAIATGIVLLVAFVAWSSAFVFAVSARAWSVHAVEPNPSIERTSQRPLRALWPAAHVER